MKYEAREMTVVELDQADLEAVTGGGVNDAGQAARDVVRNWLFNYQMKRYDSAVEIARQG